MDITIQPKRTDGLYETPLLHQTSFWSTVKHEQGIPTLAFDLKIRSHDIGSPSKAAYLLDDMLVLQQYVSRDTSIAYIPYGPSVRPDDEHIGEFLEELSESLRTHVPSSCMLLRYDLPWESPWARDPDLQGPPEPDLQELRLNWGTSERNLHKAATDQLPADTMMLDLSGSHEDILARMKAKTRYNIGLAKRRAVVTRCGTHEDMDIFYELYRQTCRRNGIRLHHRAFFEAMFAPSHQRIDTSTDFDLLVAEYGNEPLAAIFVVYSSNRATYLFGASSSEHRNLMGTYALQWEAIKRARSRGCTEYDLFGTPPNDDRSHPMHGLYRFKNGFGGHELHRMGCWDYPLDLRAYQGFVSQELIVAGYHLD
jgi:lipid II:glycine glycyltransferase (peptidoglycan interpeptide bridge formation enzyme)